MASGSIRSTYKLFVANLPWTIGSKETQYYFSKFGHVSSASVVYDKSSGISRGYAFVIFSTKDGYNGALNKSNQLLEGRILNVRPSNTSVN